MTRALIALILLCTPAIPSVGSSRNDERPVASSLATSALESGTLMRLVKMDGDELEGTILEVSATEISLSTERGVTILPEAHVFRIYEVEKRRGKGALRGLLVGLGITAALGTATLTQATEKGEGALGFGIGLLFAVPISTGVGVILSPDGETLVYENPGVVSTTRAPPEPEPETPRQPPVPTAPTEPVMPAERPRIPRSFYVTLGGRAP